MKETENVINNKFEGEKRRTTILLVRLSFVFFRKVLLS